ncbi:DUF6585 family protein [Streptomyces sp. HPF1205]|uniref:DUF6585 family protein n=1 Tax=Streptomyces sp. HPF1205 TaxID=2873262 RepID=UPI001CECB2D7|nr:DUF6585 family protein [Streptomyces sp. HPF1205]
MANSESGPSPEVARVAADHDLGPLRDSYAVKRVTFFTSRYRGDRIHCFESGFVRHDVGSAPVGFRWDRIARAYQNLTHHYTDLRRYIKTSFSFRMVRDDGTSTEFVGSYRDPALWKGADPRDEGLRLAAFGRQACEQVSRALLPGAVAALARGVDLDFAGMVINTVGVRRDDSLVPWSSIAEVRVDDGQVTIKKAGTRRSLASKSVSGIPNFPLFLTLVDQLRHGGLPTV